MSDGAVGGGSSRTGEATTGAACPEGDTFPPGRGAGEALPFPLGLFGGCGTGSGTLTSASSAVWLQNITHHSLGIVPLYILKLI